MAASDDDSRLGDYLLEELISEGTATLTYYARQVSIDRRVVLEMMKPDVASEADAVDDFLADVRAKASVEHAGIGSVYEAGRDRGVVFYTREHLRGEDFEDLHEAEVSIEPGTIASFLRQIASAMSYLEEHGVPTLPLELRHLVLGEHEVVRIVNLAVAETVEIAEEGHDRQLVAELLLTLVEEGAEGYMRTRALLDAMANQAGTALTWSEVLEQARQLEERLSEGGKAATQALESGPIEDEGNFRGSRRRAANAALGALAGVAVLGIGGLLLKRCNRPPEARDLSAMIEVSPGSYRTHDGEEIKVERFWMDAHEVTIAEYAGFLDALSQLPAEKRTGYDHPEQPFGKADHVPGSWTAILEAARRFGRFEGRPLDVNYPVTRIDWWDAYAFANWKGGRLPAQVEWTAAVAGADLEPGGIGPVDAAASDVTPAGIHGLAGNVMEWVGESAPNSGDPIEPAAPLACGGAPPPAREGAWTRTRLPDLKVRRPDLGFRIVREAAP